MKTARFIRKLKGWISDARLYKLSSPLKGNHYVIVSAVNAKFPPELNTMLGVIDTLLGDVLPSQLAARPETLIFAAKADGTAKEPMIGLTRGIDSLDHAACLKDAGYKIEKVSKL